MEQHSPKFFVGAFLFNEKGALFLRTTPRQKDRYTCLNGEVSSGESREEALIRIVQEKTNLEVLSFEFIGLTEGSNVILSENSEPEHVVFADYKVVVKSDEKFRSDPTRASKWLLPQEWLKMDQNLFAPYIYEVIENIEK